MDLKNRNLRILNFTSYSLNGAVSSILLKAYYPHCDTFFVSYRKPEDMIKRYNEAPGRYDVVIFTNFAPTTSREVFLNGKTPIVIFDHHENANWWKMKNQDKSKPFHVNQEYSGSVMVYMYYKRWMADMERFKDIAFIADDFELWKLKDIRSFHFNTLFWKSESAYAFMKRWSRGGEFALTQTEKDILTEHVRDWKLYYESLAQLEMSFNGRFITANEYHSEISKQMDMEGVNYFMVYHPKSHYITIRSCNALVDCREVLGDLKVFSASSNVGVIPCQDANEAKMICVRVENAVKAHLPKDNK